MKFWSGWGLTIGMGGLLECSERLDIERLIQMGGGPGLIAGGVV